MEGIITLEITLQVIKKERGIRIFKVNDKYFYSSTDGKGSSVQWKVYEYYNEPGLKESQRIGSLLNADHKITNEPTLKWFIQRVVKDQSTPTKFIWERKCRVCGCTDKDCSGCIGRTGYRCSWVEQDLCSACVEVK